MLYDASRAGNATSAAWFDVAFWRERGEIDGEAQGRGTTHFIHTGKQHFVLRHYRRGGLVARLMKDRYFWRDESSTRAFSEWQLLYHLHRAGLPVPAPVACRYLRHGLTYTADLITERLMDSISLAAAVRRRGLPILGWITIGRCIRSFHDLGVCHADLNAHNIMLVGDDSVYLIDFDRGRLRKPGMWCDANLVRLRRSLEKITYGLPPEHFGEADWHGLLDGYRQSGSMPGAPRAKGSRDAAEGTTSNRLLSVAADFAPAPASPAAGASQSDTVQPQLIPQVQQVQQARLAHQISQAQPSGHTPLPHQGQLPLQSPPSARAASTTVSGSPPIPSPSQEAPVSAASSAPTMTT
jgi:3-deoxy-D-manno-octulosonic acid kinase